MSSCAFRSPRSARRLRGSGRAVERERQSRREQRRGWSISWKCRCGSLELPEEPQRPSRRRAARVSPVRTATEPRCRWPSDGEDARAQLEHDVVAEHEPRAGQLAPERRRDHQRPARASTTGCGGRGRRRRRPRRGRRRARRSGSPNAGNAVGGLNAGALAEARAGRRARARRRSRPRRSGPGRACRGSAAGSTGC